MCYVWGHSLLNLHILGKQGLNGMIPGTSHKKISSSNSKWTGSIGQEGGSRRNQPRSHHGGTFRNFPKDHYHPAFAISEHDWVQVDILTPRGSALWKSVIQKLKSGGDHSLQITPWAHLK